MDGLVYKSSRHYFELARSRQSAGRAGDAGIAICLALPTRMRCQRYDIIACPGQELRGMWSREVLAQDIQQFLEPAGFSVDFYDEPHNPDVQPSNLFQLNVPGSALVAIGHPCRILSWAVASG